MQRRKDIIGISLFIIVIGLIGSCKPKDEYYYLDPEMINLFNFPSNSYWVFKDSVTGVKDSLAWIGGGRSMSHIGPSARKFSETYRFVLYEFVNDSNNHSLEWAILLANDGDRNKALLDIYLVPNVLYQIATYNPIYSKPMLSGYQGGPNLKYNQFEYIPSIRVNNIQFDSVYHTRFYTKDGSEPDEHIYFNRKAGFIKIVQRSLGYNRTLELDHWHTQR